MYGLALEGGGTKGAYHVGVMRALDELKIDIGCVVGTSIGSVNGALYVQGETDKLTKLWSSISADDVVVMPENMPEADNLFDIKNIFAFLAEMKKNGGMDTAPLEKILREVTDEERIRKSPINFGLVTYCVSGKNEERLFLKDIPYGKLVDYLLASSCLPFFKERSINSKRYIDGGVVNNLPVNMLTGAGIKDIISVEVGGLGISKKESGAGCNVIRIKMTEDAVGTLDFDKNRIYFAEQLGYFDTLRAFGMAVGGKYYLGSADYFKCRRKYGKNILNGIEKAADIFKLDRFRIYTFSELSEAVLNKYKSMTPRSDIMQILKWSDEEKTVRLAAAMKAGEAELLSNRIVSNLLGEIFEAASAIAYFL